MGVNNPYWPNVHAIIEELGAPRCMLYANLGMNAEDTDALRKIIEAEFGVKSPTLFDRAGWHNTVIDWYAEFDLVTRCGVRRVLRRKLSDRELYYGEPSE